MKFYIVRPAKQTEHPAIYVETSLEGAHRTGRDLYQHPPYVIDAVDLEVNARTIAHLIERVSLDRLRGRVFVGAKLQRLYPTNDGVLFNGDPAMYEGATT